MMKDINKVARNRYITEIQQFISKGPLDKTNIIIVEIFILMGWCAFSPSFSQSITGFHIQTNKSRAGRSSQKPVGQILCLRFNSQLSKLVGQPIVNLSKTGRAVAPTASLVPTALSIFTVQSHQKIQSIFLSYIHQKKLNNSEFFQYRKMKARREKNQSIAFKLEVFIKIRLMGNSILWSNSLVK